MVRRRYDERGNQTVRDLLDLPQGLASPGEWTASTEEQYCARCNSTIYPYEQYLVGEKYARYCGDCGSKIEQGIDWRTEPVTQKQKEYILALGIEMDKEYEMPETKAEARTLIEAWVDERKQRARARRKT